ncbi:MAG: anhydro-N-acetylmuramic acid kinase [Pseudomonadota bacterium]
MAKIKTAIGLMSGTSMDGIDVALLRTDGVRHIEFGPTQSFAFSADETQAIAAGLEAAKHIAQRTDRPGELAQLENAVTLSHAAAVTGFLNANGLDAENIDAIGFHGQTVLHRPEKALTVQLGDGAMLAEKTGIDVVWDMRANDIANGGQGAPLVPVFHDALASVKGMASPVGFVNIGGIANVTFVLGDGDPIAFDCGPGNALIDQWVQAKTNQSFDDGGALGLRGTVHAGLLERYLLDSFFEQTAPKSLDRNDFTLQMPADISAEDGAATLAELTAVGIVKAQATAGVRPKRWVVSGGGARNGAIIQSLQRQLPDADVKTADQVGLDANMMEAQCWAYLAVRCMRGLALTYPTTTGCVEACTGGIISHPSG